MTYGAKCVGAALAVLIIAPSQAAAQLDEIVVNAQKRNQVLEEIGLSVAAFDGEAAERYANDIGALAGQVPGVESYAAGTYVQGFYIRGVGLNEFAGNFNAPVATHYDEVYVSKVWQAARPHFDLRRVEILKGPQGTLFGRNTTGGAVNYYFNESTPKFEGYLRAEADQHERYNVQGAISGPLSNSLTGRLAFYSGFGTGGPQFNLFDGEEYGHPNIHQLRGQLKWESGATKIKLLAYGGFDQSELAGYKSPGVFSGSGYCPEALAGHVSFAPRTCLKFNGVAAINGMPELEIEPGGIHVIDQNHPPLKHDSFYGGYFRIEHDFGPLQLTSLTSFDRYNRDQREDPDGTPIASTDYDIFNEINEFTQELRFSGEAAVGRITYVVGGFFEHDDLFEADSVDFSQNPFNFPPSNAGLPPRLIGVFDQKVDSLAFFANAEVDLTERLALVAGGRYTRETTTLDATTNAGLNDVAGDEDLPATLLVPGGIDTVNSATSPSNPSLDGITSDKHQDADLSWKAGLNYTLSTGTLLYAVAQTGFRTGGYSVAIGGPILEFNREKVLAVELGAKARFWGDRARVTLAAFRTQTDDSQVNVDDVISPLVPVTRNIPEIVHWGVEGDFEVSPAKGLTVALGVAWLDSEITDSGGTAVTTFALAPTPLLGNRAVNTPMWRTNGRFSYERPLSQSMLIALGADFRWVDSRFYEITNQPVDRAPSYFVANARLAVASADGRWEASVFARNLFDEEYLTYINNLPGPGFKLDIFGERRTIGGSIASSF